MSIKYNEYYNDGEEEETDISYWVTNSIRNIKGIEHRQVALINLVGLLCEKVAESTQDVELLQSIAYEIECPHNNHRFGNATD